MGTGDPAEKLRAHFERSAPDFDRLYEPQRQNPLQRWLNRHFRSDIAGRYRAAIEHVRSVGAESVLDVGCGSGRYLAALAEMGVPRLVGIDFSPRMLELARADASIQKHSGVELICADVREFTTSERFDVVLAMGFFDYQDDPESILRQLRSLCNHSVVASFPHRHWFRTPFRRVRSALHGRRVYFYSSESVSELARRAGYSRSVIEPLPGAGMNLVALLYS